MAGRPRSPEVDRALLEAALAIFVERGLGGFTLDQVAGRAGVGRSALYRRWSSREELLADALRTWRSSYDDGLNDKALTLSELLMALATKAAEALEDPFAHALICRLLTLGPEGRGVLEPHLNGVVAARREVLTRAIVAAQEAGRVDPAIDPALAQDAVAGALIYKLLSGDTHLPTFDARSYIMNLFHMTGLR